MNYLYSFQIFNFYICFSHKGTQLSNNHEINRMNLNSFKSKRHHYIPKFLIKEFSNQDGLLYIYDKQKDSILDNPRSPKSIFFENERNTISLNEKETSSVIEDVFYNKLDNTSSKYIKSLQTSKITTELLSEDNLAHLQFFIINLFWRLPITDFAVNDLIKRAEIISKGVSPELLRTNKGWNKLQRMGLYRETIKQSKLIKNPRKKVYTKFKEFKESHFLIGDYPFIYKNNLSTFTDLTEDDFYIALTSNRILSYSTKPLIEFESLMLFYYNATIINQSKRYVATNNLKLLKESINQFKLMNEKNILHFAKKELFKELFKELR